MKYPMVMICRNSGLPFGVCECFECKDDKELRENTKNGGYVLDEADKSEVF